MKKYGDSRQVLKGMMDANPSSPDVMFQIGVVSLAENKFKDAEDAFRKSYQLNPANSRGLMGVVETYMAQNRPDQALQVLQAEAQKMPGADGVPPGPRQHRGARRQVRPGHRRVPGGAPEGPEIARRRRICT